MKSSDVVHSFWIPKMGGKVDVFPARANRLFFTPTETGEFYGQCVEFCGTQHANMRLRLFVDSEADFKAWADRQRQPASPPSAGVVQGAEAFQGRGCPACHTIRGTNAKGTIGPDLTHVGARKTIGAGIMDNTSDNLVQWIKDPQGVKVGNKMIALPMSDADRLAIAVYLRSLQ
jgi:cytochrome c oxidase subunit 2